MFRSRRRSLQWIQQLQQLHCYLRHRRAIQVPEQLCGSVKSAHILGVGFWNLIQKFSKVEHLSFSGNQFTKIPEWFRFPKSLKSLKISSSHVSALFLDKLNDLPDFELLVGVDINGMYDPAFSIDGRKEEEIEEKRALSFVVISFISSPIAINCLSVITP
jgi:hypothetical protein